MYVANMPNIENSSGKSLTDLGATSAAKITDQFAEIRSRFDLESNTIHDESAWKTFRDNWLGRKSGVLAQITDNWLKPASPGLKRAVGAGLNELRAHVESQIESRRQAIESGADQSARAHEHVDLSLPGVTRPIGSHHLIRQVFQDIEDIFVSIGFSVVEGPEIETPYYNFEALNIPEFHPVRDDMDTFYLDLPKGASTPLLLRTHTSPMQIRTMEKRKPPVRVIVPGKVYRRDNPDATHSFIFHQVEGLAVDADITFCDFTGTIEYFVKQFFGPGRKTSFPPRLFSVHGTECRVRRLLHLLRRQRHERRRQHLLQMQRRRLDRTLRRRHGRPRRLRLRQLRGQKSQRLRLRHGHRPPRHAEISNRRHSGLFPKRCPLPAPVPVRSVRASTGRLQR